MINRYTYRLYQNKQATINDLIVHEHGSLLKYEDVKHLLENKKIITKILLNDLTFKRCILSSTKSTSYDPLFCISTSLYDNGNLISFKDNKFYNILQDNYEKEAIMK